MAGDWRTPGGIGPGPNPLYTAMRDVAAERERQQAKFPDQHLPDAIEGDDHRLIVSADDARDLCEERHAEGSVTWADVLVEECAEAIDAAEFAAGARRSPESVAMLRAELVQVAAVCVRWIEDLEYEA